MNSLQLEEVDVVLKLGTTGTAAFVICGSTCHSKLFLPIRRLYTPLKGNDLKSLQETFRNFKVIIIDEVSMMGKKIYYILIRDFVKLQGRKINLLVVFL